MTDETNETKEHVGTVIGQVLPGSVVVFRGTGAGLDSVDVDAISQAVGHKKFLVVMLAPDVSIELLDEDEMRTHGWVRA